jgi:hypothetical protein
MIRQLKNKQICKLKDDDDDEIDEESFMQKVAKENSKIQISKNNNIAKEERLFKNEQEIDDDSKLFFQFVYDINN